MMGYDSPTHTHSRRASLHSVPCETTVNRQSSTRSSNSGLSRATTADTVSTAPTSVSRTEPLPSPSSHKSAARRQHDLSKYAALVQGYSFLRVCCGNFVDDTKKLKDAVAQYDLLVVSV